MPTDRFRGMDTLAPGDVFEIVPVHGDVTAEDRYQQIVQMAFAFSASNPNSAEGVDDRGGQYDATAHVEEAKSKLESMLGEIRANHDVPEHRLDAIEDKFTAQLRAWRASQANQQTSYLFDEVETAVEAALNDTTGGEPGGWGHDRDAVVPETLSPATMPMDVGDRITVDGDVLVYRDWATDGPLFEVVGEDPPFDERQMEPEEFARAWNRRARGGSGTRTDGGRERWRSLRDEVHSEVERMGLGDGALPDRDED